MTGQKCRMGLAGCPFHGCDEIGHGKTPELDLVMATVLEGCQPWVAITAVLATADYVRATQSPPPEFTPESRSIGPAHPMVLSISLNMMKHRDEWGGFHWLVYGHAW